MSRRRRGSLLDGVLLLDKPVGMSSNHALQRARRLLDARKAGHTGTLDPFATGLLICCFGQATKLSTKLLAADKTYIATLRLGQETDTADLDGDVIDRVSDATVIARSQPEQVKQVLSQFQGVIEQVPPMHSALKKEGRPLYEYARAGIEVERPARQVEIYRLQCLARTSSTLTIEVHCSKGTYVRTLAQDIGRALGCLAHLTALRRTQIGPFDVQQAINLRALGAAEDKEQQLLKGADLPASLLPVNF